MSTGRTWTTDKGWEFYAVAPGEELTFERLLGFVHPDDRERFRQTVQQALHSGQDLSVEYRILRPDSSVRWIASRGRAHAGSVGEPDRLMGVSIDITEHKRMAEQLKARLREIESVKQLLEGENISLREEVKLLSPHAEIVV